MNTKYLPKKGAKVLGVSFMVGGPLTPAQIERDRKFWLKRSMYLVEKEAQLIGCKRKDLFRYAYYIEKYPEAEHMFEGYTTYILKFAQKKDIVVVKPLKKAEVKL